MTGHEERRASSRPLPGTRLEHNLRLIARHTLDGAPNVGEGTCVATWLSAGLRVYDIRDPFTPKEIGAFLPETPPGQRACRISDVFVDDRSITYAGDRVNGGLYVLEYTGEQPLD